MSPEEAPGPGIPNGDPPGGDCPFTVARTGGSAFLVHGFTLGGGASTKSRRPAPAAPAAPPPAPGSPPPPTAATAGSPQRPDPRRTQPRLPGSCLPFHPLAVPGLAVSAAHGAGSGGGNVNKSGFYSYLTLECRVHLLSARYQTPAAPNRVFTKAGCANCVAETRASDTTLR